ncbi:hypothetical protein [Spongiactinospora sp. TRM90649]|uniref:phage tail tube protein n=1 Tax=Spongiactinospora sp. TRM90649 TaxID=3031114 RepID=UPI0023F8A840|nr:hypothetical protein [Spongiactinospora sp. TRM90649]MDF5758618.1 hypothetical protein [Spongiactinospora sp. TRM90649]
MADIVATGKLKFTWCLTLSSLTAPPASELNAGVDLQTKIPKGGLDEGHTQAAVDNTHISSLKETERAGTSKDEITVTFKRDDIALQDLAYNTLVPGSLGYVVIRRDKLHTTSYAAGDIVSIYPAELGVRMPEPNTINEPLQFKMKFFNHEAGQDAATVA